MNPLRAAAAFDIDSDLVEHRLDRTKPRDEQFFQCWQASHAIPVQRIPNGLAGTSGHVAESVVECWLADFGLIPIADQDGPGRHGVDLLMLDPEVETVLAIEVKGTLRAGRLPWLTKRELTQMSPAWLDQKEQFENIRLSKRGTPRQTSPSVPQLVYPCLQPKRRSD